MMPDSSCVATATNDLENQEIFSMALEHVHDKKRLVGVLTKCDMLAPAGLDEVCFLNLVCICFQTMLTSHIGCCHCQRRDR